MNETATVRSIVAGGDIDWQPPIPGAFGSSFRLGEWITGPVTPLFEDWALTRLESAMHGWHFETIGQPAPLPHHVVINGWYFYSLAWLPITPRALLRWAPRLVHRLFTRPRLVAPVIPPTVHLGIHLLEQQWRDEIRPAYRQAVAAAEASVEHLEPAALLELVDDLLVQAGRYFASLTAVAGGAYKAEIQLGTFYQAHIAPHVDESYLALLIGLHEPSAPPPHAVESLDWSYPTVGEQPGRAGSEPRRTGGSLRQRREAAETAAHDVLGSSGRRRRAFDRRLALAQHLGPVRETQAREFTLPWPVLRRALARLGAAACSVGTIGTTDDVFYLRHEELAQSVGGHATSSLAPIVAERRAAVEAAAKLKPPLFAGDLPQLFERINRGMLARLGMEPTAEAALTGVAVSPGIVSGPVRIVLDASGFDDVQPGDVLVAPTTAPAWNPLFARAGAVVTDGGNLFSHASVVAREYGIPAVVGCGDATRRLSAGQHVTVDGTKGTVTLVR